MSDLHCTEALDSVRIRFKVLKQVKPGDIIVLDAAGRWLIQSPTTVPWPSAIRKMLALLSYAPVDSRRQAFLKSAKESVRVVIDHSRLLMKTQLFNRALDETGSISFKSLQKLTPNEAMELEGLLSMIRSFCTDMYEAMAGLDNVVKHQPYAEDLTFCSEIQVSLCDPVREFFEQTYRRLGVFGPKLIPFATALVAGAASRPKELNPPSAAAPAPTFSFMSASAPVGAAAAAVPLAATDESGGAPPAAASVPMLARPPSTNSLSPAGAAVAAKKNGSSAPDKKQGF